MPTTKRDVLRWLASRGGKAAARAMTQQQRTARARKAGLARQAKARAKRGGRQ